MRRRRQHSSDRGLFSARSTTMRSTIAIRRREAFSSCPICKPLWTTPIPTHRCSSIEPYAKSACVLSDTVESPLTFSTIPFPVTILTPKSSGLIREAHTSLSDIQNTQRSKEVLAQGIPPRQGTERTPEQELKERSMQVSKCGRREQHKISLLLHDVHHRSPSTCTSTSS